MQRSYSRNFSANGHIFELERTYLPNTKYITYKITLISKSYILALFEDEIFSFGKKFEVYFSSGNKGVGQPEFV